MTTISTGLPEVEAYRVCAIGHLNAANLLHDRLISLGIENTDSTWLALQSLIGFAAENALKTYLSSHGLKRKSLKRRDFGHDLNAILAKSIEFGLEADGVAIAQPNLASALRRYTDLCGNDFTSFNYRYLEGEDVQVLSSGEATITVLRAIECVIDISVEKVVT
jgi:hypothetical protein